jgi:excisionase family DNA binding protein
MPTVVKGTMLPTRAIAEAIGMSIDFVYTEIRDGELDAVKIGREYRIRPSEAVRYLETLQVPVPPEWFA